MLETFFSRIGAAGLALLVVTGPLTLWLKFGSPAALSGWFAAKMTFVMVALIGVVIHEWAAARFKKDDERATRMMFIGGRAAGIGIVMAMLCATLTFN